MAAFDQSKAYAPQEEGTNFFDDGREIELLHFVYSHPKLESIRGSPQGVLAVIDEYGRTKKYLMNVGEDKGRIVTDLIAEVKPKTMVELGGYVGYSCILFGDAVRKANGQRYYSLERNPEFAAVIASLVDLAGLSDIVKVVVGSSDASIARLHAADVFEHIDLMFLDHYKPAYTTDLKLCEELGLITVGSVLSADNVIKPGNPPYLEYVRSSVQEKKAKAHSGEMETHGQGILEKNVKQYAKRYGEEKLSESKGNPNLVYESRLVESFEPTGVPHMSLPLHSPKPHSIIVAAPRPSRLITLPRMSSPTSLTPFFYNHVPKNLLLILFSILCLPFSTFLLTASILISYIYPQPASASKSAQHGTAPPKTVLITGVSMTKGLVIARLLSLHTPHRIIAADIETTPFTSPGRYSCSISTFHALDAPDGEDSEPYIDSLLTVLRKENVDLWISCSSVVGAVEDAQVLRLAQQALGPSFHAIQFSLDHVRELHEKDAFMSLVRDLHLPAPDSHRCESSAEVLAHLLPRSSGEKGTRKTFILKPIGVDDCARAAMMTLLPLQSPGETRAHVERLAVSKHNPFLLQQFIDGAEYCTHALVIRGEVRVFVACPSSELLMHYKALSPASPLAQKMLGFTKVVAEHGGEGFTGHLSFDFLVRGGGEDVELYPIECNPRAHTAVVLFGESKEMADAYLDGFGRGSGKGVVVPSMPCHSYYWVGHDLIALIVIPLLELLCGRGSLGTVWEGMERFVHHLIYWRDGTYTLWDPLPFWILYQVYWPAQFFRCLVKGCGWSRLNVSTTKVFQS
ncbi:hypothetical protein EJ04DRAFT_545767 [Polyplosphaeria fusca]|uniref:catechol O-methyltransferase n=1 Tax=Polyplosphaeria fusca TaxID=682080 RepID=A0A9P4QT31_9PLEO|nr:hypothetical protein EJ04DRAFT_545767 [Polyplosphaeria fusca]